MDDRRRRCAPGMTGDVAGLLDRPGTLVRVLTPLSRHDLNLTKLESRPTGEPWTYHFVLEFEHVTHDPHVASALRDVEREAARCRVAGTYARE
jgi:chorismate mutase/prephenate dehydratase